MSWGQAKTGLVVVVLSLLVWVLAESQTLRTEHVTVLVTITAEPGGASLARVVDNDWTGEVELTLAGSAAAVTDTLERLGGRVDLQVGRELGSAPGTQAVVLREALRRSEKLRESGVTIAEIRPESVAVEVDRAETFELPVTARLPAGREAIAGRITPGSVRVRAPAGLVSGLDRSSLECVAEVSADALAGVTPGREDVIAGVRVRAPAALEGAWGVSVAPPIVDVVVTVQTRTRSYTIPRLPVQVMLPPPELGRWRIELAPETTDLFDVLLTGPSGAIERIASGEITPTAVVTLSFQELADGIGSKEARIAFLPPGVTAAIEDATVQLSIDRIEEGPPSPGTP